MKIFFGIVSTLTIFLMPPSLAAQTHSVARQWNEMLLTSIRHDLARPTVHARNLFHVSAAMYDAWAVYEETASTYLLGNSKNGYVSVFEGITPLTTVTVRLQQEEAISYAAYRILRHRFRFSPNSDSLLTLMDQLHTELGYDKDFTSTDYTTGSPAALGNYIAETYINYGLEDGSREASGHANFYYLPVNPPLEPVQSGNPDIEDLNRWQPLALEVFIDQSGNRIPDALDFLSPEWGNVYPFAMDGEDRTAYERDGNRYWVYHDPGDPPYIEDTDDPDGSHYKWGFGLVTIWGAHLDPADGVMWDISPASIGNIEDYPDTPDGYRDFYDELDGGDPSRGWDLNPVTGEPYEPQIVPRADYARVLAEFWADGPDSETPPGHWFTLLNYVNDHPQLEKRFQGEGEVLTDLEWDVKAYFTLGGAMHDAAISAWSIKGWYDYIRPVSAIRAMADLGQSSDEDLSNYHSDGIVLKEGYIELVEAGDPLEGRDGVHIGKIKLYTWRGPLYIDDPEADLAGVGWILAENWWPYQRPTFVTPPFAGYVSGHSTYSRAAAEVMTLLTGDPFFPGGLGEFEAKNNEFLVFEEGPSVDVTLQWATYRDASDQTSLSRIWGGIHPPADDIPGRLIGEKVGVEAFEYAKGLFENVVTSIEEPAPLLPLRWGPNPVQEGEEVTIELPANSRGYLTFHLLNAGGSRINEVEAHMTDEKLIIHTKGLRKGLYLLRLSSGEWTRTLKVLVL